MGGTRTHIAPDSDINVGRMVFTNEPFVPSFCSSFGFLARGGNQNRKGNSFCNSPKK